MRRQESIPLPIRRPDLLSIRSHKTDGATSLFPLSHYVLAQDIDQALNLQLDQIFPPRRIVGTFVLYQGPLAQKAERKRQGHVRVAASQPRPSLDMIATLPQCCS